MYTIYINPFAKVFSVVFSGCVTGTESAGCMEEFKRKVENIIPSEYALLVDTQSAQKPSPDVQKTAGEMLRWSKTPFKTQFHFC